MSFLSNMSFEQRVPTQDDRRKQYNNEEFIRRLVSVDSTIILSSSCMDRCYYHSHDWMVATGYIIWALSVYYEVVVQTLLEQSGGQTTFYFLLAHFVICVLICFRRSSRRQTLQQKKEGHVQDLIRALQAMVNSNFSDREAARTVIVQLAYLGKQHSAQGFVVMNIYDPAEYAVAMLKHPHLGREIEEEKKFRRKLRTLAIWLFAIPLAFFFIPLVTYCTTYGFVLFVIFVLPGIIYQIKRIRQRHQQMEDLVQDMYLIATGYAADSNSSTEESRQGDGVEEMVPLYSSDPFAINSSPQTQQQQQQQQQQQVQPQGSPTQAIATDMQAETPTEIQAERQALITKD